MLNRTNQVDKYSVISVARFISIQHAESAIESNNKLAYSNAKTMYSFLNRQIWNDVECAFLDARKPSRPFPEWPEPAMRPVFSDEEINSWPVVFSDENEDMPF